jgi:DNA primase small subunit
MIDKREFGFALFEGWMSRHKQFQNQDELTSFLRNYTPKDAYFSCAYYENPKAEMDKKNWLGADLIFDIDADHIPTTCSKIHDQWACGNCGFEGKGILLDKCPICGGEKFETSTWPCEVCLLSAKEETVKLLDMLSQDFSFSEKEIRIYFSGHRGYHVHVENDAVKMLDTVARKEIVDYVLGLGIDTFLYRKRGRDQKSAINYLLNLTNFGWMGRIARSAYTFISRATKEDLIAIGIRKNIAESIYENKGAITEFYNYKDFKKLMNVKGLGPKTWRKIIKHCIEKQAVKVDTVVTTDIHRLIRIPETLHGKTGLKKVELSFSNIDIFDPFKDAIAFKKGEIAVLVSDAPEFRVGDETFGPYKNCKVELPTAAALLLICKGKAEVAD